jgi:hypothetical protein
LEALTATCPRVAADEQGSHLTTSGPPPASCCRGKRAGRGQAANTVRHLRPPKGGQLASGVAVVCGQQSFGGLRRDLDLQLGSVREPDRVEQGGTGVLAYTDAHTDVVGNFTAKGSALSGSSAYDPWGTGASAVAEGHASALEVAEELVPFGVGRGAVFLAGAELAAADEGAVAVDGFLSLSAHSSSSLSSAGSRKPSGYQPTFATRYPLNLARRR